MRFVASGLCLLGLGGVAEAQDAREFWQSEWQRQPQRDASLGGSGWGGSAYQEQQPSSYSRLPEKRAPQARTRESRPERRKIATVRVTNPTFLTYAPDKLTNVALGAA